MRDDEGSGDDIKDILSHSVMIQRERSRKEPISLPLGHDSEGVVKKRADILPTLATEKRGDVSERKRAIERAIKTSAGSNGGKGAAPWECDPRIIRAGGRSRGLHSKAWTGRGPGGRGFLRPCKNLRHPRTSHGRHHFPACERPAGKRATSLPGRRPKDGERRRNITKSALLGVSLHTSRADSGIS